MNAQLAVVASINPARAASASQATADASPAADADPSQEGGFKAVLEQRMQPAAGQPASSAPVPDAAADAVPAQPDIAQVVDLNQITNDALAAFMASQSTLVTRLPDASDAPSTGAIQASLGRALATEWKAFGEGERAGRGIGAADTRSDPAAAMLAAMGADAGKRLPQQAGDLALTVPGVMPAAGDGPAVERAADSFATLLAASDGASANAGALTNQLSSALPAVSSEPRSASTQVSVPFGRPEWNNALGERVTWLVGQRVQSAEIQINPPQLGPVEVRITLQNDQATLMFSSSHAAVRDALQAALPRLNDLLAQSGISLGQTSVGAESFAGQQQGFRQPGGQSGQSASGAGTLDPLSGVLTGSATAADTLAARGLALLRGSSAVDMFV